ncbi:MAG: arabinosyltransferase, partial [Rhodococcus sp.]|nr:arabinosyltransferase [Rhodococcus sp. (in: high G+C Gram-positive bacteria)]
MTVTERQSEARRVRLSRTIAIVTGLLGFVLALATPFLPVNQTAASVNWPQSQSMESVTAPLVSYTPTELDVTIPCAALSPDVGTVVATLPEGADRPTAGLTAAVAGDTFEVRVHNRVLASGTLAELQGCESVHVTSTSERTAAEII